MPSLTQFKRHQAVLGTVPEVSRKIEDGLSEAGIAIITKQLPDGERRLANKQDLMVDRDRLPIRRRRLG